MSQKNITSRHLQARIPHDPILGIIALVVALVYILPSVRSLEFNFTSFEPNGQNITYEKDAFASSGIIQLTKNQQDSTLTDSVGRASYSHQVQLWDPVTGNLTDFTTHFTFRIKQASSSEYGDGLAFFLAPFNATTPNNSTGGSLGLFSAGQTSVGISENSTVGVEFDSYMNTFDPSDNHVGIDVNSIVSVTNVSWPRSMKDGSTANAWITYNATTYNLSVFLTYADNPTFDGNSSLWYIIDLRTVLPDQVRVGFSAATGSWVEIHNILTWSFSSTLEIVEPKRSKMTLMIGIAAAAFLSISIVGLVWFILWRKRHTKKSNEDLGLDVVDEDDFEKGTGPKRFTYRELSRSTSNFHEEGKLGEGGFGGVYRGLLTNPSTEVAVKRVSRTSKQGRKEYISEVRIISRLRHRNLVQLIGWCHEQGELLLVYEFMPNGSLDTHLFGKKDPLPWPTRHKIALGLASALLYLHEEWEQCVVHRDIKSSNVMLDSNFNAKLGDFGLARLVDHGLGSQTTVLAGTMGYLAPECLTTGKASKESDVYSFGVVALEIACGRKPVKPNADESQIRLVEWVWDLYGKNQLSQAFDRTLDGHLDETQIETLMIVGLWCCHPDYTIRPTIKQAINVLNLEASIPCLPVKFPVPVYLSSMMETASFSYSSSYSNANHGKTESQVVSGVGNSMISDSSTRSASSTAPLLKVVVE
ncbi:L-type lectin-domain containing receptor kinase IX.1-like protein [Drosera capensis]